MGPIGGQEARSVVNSPAGIAFLFLGHTPISSDSGPTRLNGVSFASDMPMANAR